MEKHPASMILDIIKETSIDNNSPSIQIGKILTSPPEIQVSYNGMVLTKEDLYISEYLLVGYTRQARGHLVSGTQPATCTVSHSHPINNDYTESFIFTDTLQPGDLVSLMPMVSSDNSTQQYIILDKIVHL